MLYNANGNNNKSYGAETRTTAATNDSKDVNERRSKNVLHPPFLLHHWPRSQRTSGSSDNVSALDPKPGRSRSPTAAGGPAPRPAAPPSPLPFLLFSCYPPHTGPLCTRPIASGTGAAAGISARGTAVSGGSGRERRGRAAGGRQCLIQRRRRRDPTSGAFLCRPHHYMRARRVNGRNASFGGVRTRLRCWYIWARFTAVKNSTETNG